MQTFLPYPSFSESAKVLDYRRLGKQRVEAWQILNALRADYAQKGWKNHPATKMWRGHELALAVYGKIITLEWISRGYKDSMLPRFNAIVGRKRLIPFPQWVGDEEFHLSHRSNLVRKDKEFYGTLWPNIPDSLPYVWPVGK